MANQTTTNILLILLAIVLVTSQTSGTDVITQWRTQIIKEQTIQELDTDFTVDSDCNSYCIDNDYDIGGCYPFEDAPPGSTGYGYCTLAGTPDCSTPETCACWCWNFEEEPEPIEFTCSSLINPTSRTCSSYSDSCPTGQTCQFVDGMLTDSCECRGDEFAPEPFDPEIDTPCDFDDQCYDALGAGYMCSGDGFCFEIDEAVCATEMVERAYTNYEWGFPTHEECRIYAEEQCFFEGKELGGADGGAGPLGECCLYICGADLMD